MYAHGPHQVKLPGTDQGGREGPGIVAATYVIVAPSPRPCKALVRARACVRACVCVCVCVCLQVTTNTASVWMQFQATRKNTPRPLSCVNYTEYHSRYRAGPNMYELVITTLPTDKQGKIARHASSQHRV